MYHCAKNRDHASTLVGPQESKRSLSTSQIHHTCESEFLPKLPNLLAESLFLGPRHAHNGPKGPQDQGRKDKQSSQPTPDDAQRRTWGIGGKEKQNDHKRLETTLSHTKGSRHYKLEPKTQSHKTPLPSAHDQAKHSKSQDEPPNTLHKPSGMVHDIVLEQQQHTTHELLPKHDTIAENSCKDDATNFRQSSKRTARLPRKQPSRQPSPLPLNCCDESQGFKQISPQHVNYCGDVVYVQDEGTDNDASFMRRLQNLGSFEELMHAHTGDEDTASVVTVVASEADSYQVVEAVVDEVIEPAMKEFSSFDPEESMPVHSEAESDKSDTDKQHHIVQALLLKMHENKTNQPVVDNNTTASTNGERSVMDDIMTATTVDAMVSPGRSVKKTNSRSKNIFRGQTIAVNGTLDTKCVQEEKLQNLKHTFTKYDEDHNGVLNVLEFGKFLKDQGMEIDVSDAKAAVAMVVPEAQSGIDLASFTQLVAHGLQAEALREEQHCGYSNEEAEVLRKIFDAYDVNHSGVMEAVEISNLLQDMGQAPKSLSEQRRLRTVLETIVGNELRPLRFREFLKLAKILDTTTIGSGGKHQEDPQLEHRRSTDRMEVARKAGLTMTDVARLHEIFANESRLGNTLSGTEVYDLLRSRLKLHAAEGEREQKVHMIIEKYAVATGSLDFDDFLVIVGDLVNDQLGTVPSLLGQRSAPETQRSTDHFLGHMAALLE